MKSKKLISFLCAAAMTTSAFAGLTVASAADTALWSDDFNKQTAGLILDGTYVDGSTDAGQNGTVVPGLTFFTTNRNRGDAGVYINDADETVYTGSYYSIEQRDKGDQSLHLSYPIFGDYGKNGRWGHVDFKEAYTADETKDIVMDFDLKMTDGMIQGVTDEDNAVLTNPIFRVGAFDPNSKSSECVAISKDDAGIGDDWVHARIIVTNSGAKAYINGTEVASAANASVKKLESIGLYFSEDSSAGNITPPLDAKGDWLKAEIPTKSPAVDIDNVVIYSTDAGAATATSAAPKAESQTPGGDVQPWPTPEVIPDAPTLAAPASAEEDSIELYDFEDAKGSWYIQDDEQNIEDISGLNIHLGGRKGGEASSFAEIKNSETGKILLLQAGKFSHAGRGPLLSVKTSMADALAEGKTIAMSFAVKLSKPKGLETGAIPRLYFLKSDRKAGDDGNGAYNQIAAVLTTDIDEEIHRSDENSDIISVYTTPDEWHYVTFVVSPTDKGATHRLYMDGEEASRIDCDYVGSGDSAEHMEDLPLLSPQSKAAKINGEDVDADFSLATIDNLMVYYGEPSEPRRMCATVGEAPVVTKAPATPKPATPAPKHVANITYANGKASVSTEETEPFDGVLIAANYRADGTLEKVALTKELTGISSTAIDTEVAMAEGDKLMVWNNLKDMVPYGTYTVTAEQASATKAPANTPMPTPEPTATPEVTADPNATDTPATEAPAPKYAVTGTVDTGVKSVTLTDKTDNTKTISGTIAETAVTFANVPAGTYTVTAEAKTGYKDLTIKKGDAAVTEVTVTDADVTDAFAVTTTAIVLPDISAKTVMAESDFSTADTWGFTAGRNDAVPAVDNGKLVVTKGNNSQDGKQPQDVKTFDAGVTASADTEVMFDYSPQIDTAKNRWSTLSLTDSEDNVIFSFASMGNVGIGYALGQRAVFENNALAAPAVKIADKGGAENVLRVYLHLVKGESKNTVSGYIFNVAGETPVFVAEIPATDVTASNVGKIVAQEGYSAAPQAIDNVKIVTNDTGWKPAQAITVTAPAETDGTLAVDKTSVVPGTTVTITATAKPGKKVASVTVMNGETAVDVTAGENGTYTFTMPEADVTVSATYARADINTIEVSGPKTVSSAATSTYTAVAKAADGTVLEGITFTWSVTGGGTGTSITDAGVLTVAEAEADQTALTIKAAAEEKEGTLAANVTKATVYTITKATDLAGGSVATDKMVGIEGAEVVVTPTAAIGYHVTSVTYTPEVAEGQTATPVNVLAAEGVYKFAMPAANVTVSATFAKTDYAITNATAADAGGTITVAATAQMGDTVTVTANPAEGKEFDAITVVPTTEGSTTTITVTGNTFVMPAEPVTVTATFANPVPKYVEFADGKIQAVTVSKNNADKTYAQLKKAEATLADVKVEEGVLLADQGQLNGGKYSSLADAATIIKVDASSAGTSKVELGFKATCTAAGKNSDVRIAKIDISDIGAATYNTIAGIDATGGATIGNGNASGVSMKYDITADIAADEDKVLYYVIYTYTARQQKLTDLALTVTPLYTATVTVKDDAETPAAVAEADVTIKNGDATVATGKTTAEGTFTANLEAGSYTVDVTKDGYANVTGTALTVAAEGANSVNITLQAQSDPTFPVTVNTAPFASVKLNAGTSTAGTEVATQTVTANENGVATLADVPAGDYTVDVTSANSYLANKTGVSITAAKDTPVTVALEYKDATMVYGEDFGGYTAVGAWNTGKGEARAALIGDDAGNKYLQGKCTNKQTGHLIYALGEAVSLANKTVTVEYDFRVADHSTAVMTGLVSLGDSEGNVAFAVGQKSTTWNMAYYTGGAFSNSTASPTWGLDAKAEAGSTEVKAAEDTEAFNGTGWYHITIVFADGKAALTVTDKADSTKTKTISDIAVASTDIKNIKLAFGKAFGGANGGGQTASVGELDNVTITSVAAE